MIGDCGLLIDDQVDQSTITSSCWRPTDGGSIPSIIEHGHFERGALAASALLTDFTVDVADVFDAQ
jgi:hypothetical protein